MGIYSLSGKAGGLLKYGFCFIQGDAGLIPAMTLLLSMFKYPGTISSLPDTGGDLPVPGHIFPHPPELRVGEVGGADEFITVFQRQVCRHISCIFDERPVE